MQNDKTQKRQKVEETKRRMTKCRMTKSRMDKTQNDIKQNVSYIGFSTESEFLWQILTVLFVILHFVRSTFWHSAFCLFYFLSPLRFVILCFVLLRFVFLRFVSSAFCLFCVLSLLRFVVLRFVILHFVLSPSVESQQSQYSLSRGLEESQ